MITIYTGTPGSGKSLHVAEKIFYGLRAKKNYICNFPINLDVVKGKKGNRMKGRFDYIPTFDITPQYLYEYAKKYHKEQKEHQTIVVIDECSLLFNPRHYSDKTRIPWIEFLQLHRHLGYDFILITQADRLIDKQIRSFIEYEVIHRKVSNYKIFGHLLKIFLQGDVFVAIKKWYSVKEKVSSDMFRFNKKYAKLYDTFMTFDRNEHIEDKKDIAVDQVNKNNDEKKEGIENHIEPVLMP